MEEGGMDNLSLEEKRMVEEYEDEEDQDTALAAKLGNGGLILVLFETPTGFALFTYDGIKLLRPDAITGIKCLHNAEVMELMWGLNNLKEHLVPDGKSEPSKDYGLPMCEGMKYVLDKYGRGNVKPELVNSPMIEVTGLVYECDYVVRKHGKRLCCAVKHLKKLSGINCENWDLMKLATAVMLLCFPNGEYKLPSNIPKLFGDDYSKLVEDALKYKFIFMKWSCFRAYSEMLRARKARENRTAAPSQPVGWPLVRAFRKNLSTPKPADAEDLMNKVKLCSEEGNVCRDATQERSPSTMFVKVNLEGYAVGRKIDLEAHRNYDSLSQARQSCSFLQ
uniref:Auxin-responsive protein n=1 Tax=Leersia perrieri TaxID=77586 RepID=A0A0D9X3N3_9ORYZ